MGRLSNISGKEAVKILKCLVLYLTIKQEVI